MGGRGVKRFFLWAISFHPWLFSLPFANNQVGKCVCKMIIWYSNAVLFGQNVQDLNRTKSEMMPTASCDQEQVVSYIELYTGAAYLQCNKCRIIFEGKTEWESTQVGTVPVPACNAPTFHFWHVFRYHHLPMTVTVHIKYWNKKKHLNIGNNWSWGLDLVPNHQAGGPTGRPPRQRGGGAEDGAGHQGECGRHH